MLKRDFLKLKVGQRVVVTGTQDEKVFVNEPGVIIKPTMGLDVCVQFDNWHDGWSDVHVSDRNCWGFEASNARKFTITVVPEAPKVEEAAKPWPTSKPKKRPHGAQEYKGNGKHNWEKVVGDCLRLRVPGGWLYGQYSNRISRVINTTFVPVPQAVGYAV